MADSNNSLDSNDTDLSRAEVVYRKIKQQIISNEILPGYQELEPAIAQRMGVSRTPVREALIRLETEKFIELIPRRGMKVLPMFESDVSEMLQILSCLERLGFELLVNKLKSEALGADISEIRALLFAMESAAIKSSTGANESDSWLMSEDDFLFALLSLAGSQRLIEVVSSIRNQLARARRIMVVHTSFPSLSTSLYKKIIAAIENRNWAELCTIHQEHISVSSECMSEVFNTDVFNRRS